MATLFMFQLVITHGHMLNPGPFALMGVNTGALMLSQQDWQEYTLLSQVIRRLIGVRFYQKSSTRLIGVRFYQKSSQDLLLYEFF